MPFHEKKTINAPVLKRALLLFWAAWLSLVFTTNVLDRAKAIGLLDQSWPFASGNDAFVCQTTARHGSLAWVNGVLFAGVVCWLSRRRKSARSTSTSLSRRRGR